MKYMIASDIHGSAYYCEKLIECLKEEKADRLILLGDILYHGPRNDLPRDYAPKKVIAMLNPLKDKIYCVRGNCDAEVDQMVLDFPIMADYAIFSEGKYTVFATHGHVYGPDRLPQLKDGGILLCGHTHVPACELLGNEIRYMNPGSVSIPKEDSWHGYMIWENDSFFWKDFEGNVYKTF
ncbi:MAG: phosphodiesterase [Lachnospiraceae bacterium]|nr:phosphodiesterase [Lachnospiraceae bacterium]